MKSKLNFPSVNCNPDSHNSNSSNFNHSSNSINFNNSPSPIKAPNSINFYPKTKSNCNIQIYTNFLIACPYRAECTKLANVVLGVSHDSVNRFLNNNCFEPKQIFKEAKSIVGFNPIGGYLSVDDTILDKPYSLYENCQLLGSYYSGKHKRPVKGICLVTLFYTDLSGRTSPVNFRIFVKSEKSKNQHYRDMVKEVIEWGIRPKFMTADCFYATKENLCKWRGQGYCLCVNVASNNIIEYGQFSEEGKFLDEGESNNKQYNKLHAQQCKVKDLNYPKDGLIVHYPGAGLVKIFRMTPRLGKSYLYSLVKLESIEEMEKFTKADFKKLNAKHWNIELYHRTLKSFCAIEKFMVRSVKAITNHIFCSLRGFVILTYNRLKKVLKSVGDLRMRLYNRVCESFIVVNCYELSYHQSTRCSKSKTSSMQLIDST
jgi:Transposase DDE domain